MEIRDLPVAPDQRVRSTRISGFGLTASPAPCRGSWGKLEGATAFLVSVGANVAVTVDFGSSAASSAQGLAGAWLPG